MDLKILSYNRKWIEYEFLSHEMLEQQMAEFNCGEDSNPEHFRYRAFMSFLESHSEFTDQQIHNFIELVELDSDPGMASSALSDLIQSGKLNPSQYLEVKLAFVKFGKWTEDIITRIENPHREAFNQAFCEQLEYAITKQLPQSNQGEVSKYFCDGIEYQHYSKKEVNDRRRITTRIWLGKDGQVSYEARIELGKYALRGYARGADMTDCIPDDHIDEWFEIDEERRMVNIKLY